MGVNFHELKFGKPSFDYVIDDKSIFLKELVQIIKKIRLIYLETDKSYSLIIFFTVSINFLFVMKFSFP